MNLVFNKEGEYTSPICRVYSVNLEGAIASYSTGDGPVDEVPVEDDGEIGG